MRRVAIGLNPEDIAEPENPRTKGISTKERLSGLLIGIGGTRLMMASSDERRAIQELLGAYVRFRFRENLRP